MRRALFRDEGSAALVLVLSDCTDNDFRRVKLRLLQQFRPSPMHGDLPREDWEVSSKKGCEAFVGWTLDYLEES